MQIKTIITLILVMLYFTAAKAEVFEKQCTTHETCIVGTICQCTIMPSSAFNRYFFVDIPKLEKGKFYQCKFSDGPSILTIMLDDSIFPQGTDVKCQGACPQFPLEIDLDTTKMTAETDSASVKYFVPASDIPDNLTVECRSITTR